MKLLDLSLTFIILYAIIIKTVVNSVYQKDYGGIKMSKQTTNTRVKLCVLCKYWNGAIGSTTIRPLMGQSYEYDRDEKQSCFQKRTTTAAWNYCAKFEKRDNY